MSFFTPVYTAPEGSELEVYADFAVEFMPRSHQYRLHHRGARIKAVSVTSVLRVLDKPALLAWAEACGAEGAVTLHRLGELDDVPANEAIDRVRLHKLGMDAKRDAGADRGTAVHSVLEHWHTHQAVPNLGDFPAEQRGYVQGLCAWLLDAQPKPTSVERFVGSVEHTYAGRMDMRAVIDGRDCIVDLKTSPRGKVYPEAHAQARAYAVADVECGNPEPDGIVIVGVGAEGNFTQVECQASAEDWLSILACYRSMTRLRSDLRKAA